MRAPESSLRIVVVGGGVLGTLHAYEALARGADVVHLERDPIPQGATVRNFGLIWVSGRRDGGELALAQRARDLWQEIARCVPAIGFRANGSLTLITSPEEEALARAQLAREDANERGFALLTRAEAVDLNPAVSAAIEGALWCSRDAVVESRVALTALRKFMMTTGRYRYHPGREVVEVADAMVKDHLGQVHSGDQIFICAGAQARGALGELVDRGRLRDVRLHMAETAPSSVALTTSVANADSFRYYPAYEELRSFLPPPTARGALWGHQLLCQQRLDGRLTIGDTHETPDLELFWSEQEPLQMIEESARAALADLPAIERRWTGVYAQVADPSRDGVYLRLEVARHVVVVNGAGGRGMTCAPAIAQESFAHA